MTCPRCETDMPYEALYCPYCSLLRPKNASTVSERLFENTVPSRERKPATAVRINRRTTSTPARRSEKGSHKLRFSVLAVAALIAAGSVGVYTFVIPIATSQQPEPKTVLSALDTLRHMPSNEPGLTIDGRLSRELEKSRRVGNLVGYQGWTVNRIKGTKSKVLLAFSFREIGETENRAEWLADLVSNTFTPQTELAVSISAK